MGGAVAKALREAGRTVVWASAERSPATRQRAQEAGLEDVGSLAELRARSDILLAICPPHSALELAIALNGYSGIYVDANAIAPQTAEQVAAAVVAAGGSYVDASIIGPAPHAAGTTRLYLSGEKAEAVAGELGVPLLEAVVLSGPPTAASAIKMAHAGWTKGSAALLLTMRAAARTLGVEDSLVAEWEQSQPGLVERSNGLAQSTAARAWRWSGEMTEIAVTLADAGLPDGFHQAAGEVFSRIGGELDPDDLHILAQLLDALTRAVASPPPPEPAGASHAREDAGTASSRSGTSPHSRSSP